MIRYTINSVAHMVSRTLTEPGMSDIHLQFPHSGAKAGGPYIRSQQALHTAFHTSLGRTRRSSIRNEARTEKMIPWVKRLSCSQHLSSDPWNSCKSWT